MPFAALLRWLGLALWLCLILPTHAQQPQSGTCLDRPRIITGALYADYLRWCVESVIEAEDVEPLAFTALEAAPDGALYATLPLSGRVARIDDSDGDELPDRMSIIARGLTLPNGLAWHEGDLYVAGGSHIYRISARDQRVATIVEDLPGGGGYPVGGIVIGADDRLYAAVGAPCDYCEFDDRQRGLILSMRLDGSDRRVVATGLRNPADVAFYRGRLWSLDSAPRDYQEGALDELNRIEAGGWYGFPYCLGAGQRHLGSDEIDCADSIPPRVRFGVGATPASLAAYPHDTMTGTADTLIVLLRGEPTQVDIVGYKLVMIHFDESDEPLGASLLLPYRIESGRQAYMRADDDGFFWEKFITLNELGWGIYPQQPLALAVNDRGWIYISLTGGRIIVLRPANGTVPWDDFYPIWTPMHPDYDPDDG